MKTWLLTFLLVSIGLPSWRWLVRVREHNVAQTQAQAAARQGQTAEAVYYYQQAVALAGRGGPTPALLLDLAHAQTQAGQLAAARATYGRLLGPSVPTAIGSTARQQLAALLASQRQVAQAVNLLKQALLLNPANATARYNYELLSQYLAGQRAEPLPSPPALGPPPAPATPQPKKQPGAPQPADQGTAPSAGTQAGNDRPGTTPDPTAAPPPQPTPASSTPTPSPAGQPDSQLPTPAAGGSAKGGFRPGSGPERPLPTGTQPGRQRGLDASAQATGREAPTGRGQRPGTEPATDADLQLQTQRERLKAMNLTPAQAQQLLEALRASEQQYLQQRPRARQGTPPPLGTPTW
ncbi:MAG: tetratricopeptide repeat protein [Janthinobacterium lividum]